MDGDFKKAWELKQSKVKKVAGDSTHIIMSLSLACVPHMFGTYINRCDHIKDMTNFVNLRRLSRMDKAGE